MVLGDWAHQLCASVFPLAEWVVSTPTHTRIGLLGELHNSQKMLNMGPSIYLVYSNAYYLYIQQALITYCMPDLVATARNSICTNSCPGELTFEWGGTE